MVFICTRCPSVFWKIANHCNVLICTTNQIYVPWTVINVELSINFEELLVQINLEHFQQFQHCWNFRHQYWIQSISGKTNLLIIQQFIVRITFYEI